MSRLSRTYDCGRQNRESAYRLICILHLTGCAVEYPPFARGKWRQVHDLPSPQTISAINEVGIESASLLGGYRQKSTLYPASMLRRRLNAVLEQNVLSANVFLHLLQHI
jgi:hypothetical protein